MVQFIPPPDPQTLLPSLLAHLPTAYASPTPPPSLLPILTPILRQRLQYRPTSDGKSWLPLLSWDSSRADKLVEHVAASMDFDFHPATGELELGDAELVGIRRRDEETLQAKMILRDRLLEIIYLWCMGDRSQGGDAWKVAEVNVLTEPMDKTGAGKEIWFRNVSDADEAFFAPEAERFEYPCFKKSKVENVTSAATQTPEIKNGQHEGEDDEDEYWKQYDMTPSTRSPAVNQSVNRQSAAEGHRRSTSEAEYYARYAHVQPAMDPTDHAETAGQTENEKDKENTEEHRDCYGRVIHDELLPRSPSTEPPSMPGIKPARNSISLPRAEASPFIRSNLGMEPIEKSPPTTAHPRPSSSSSSGSQAVEKLESAAAAQEAGSSGEVAVKQHISTTFKALFRLARTAGIDRDEFERLIQVELSVLELIENEEGS